MREVINYIKELLMPVFERHGKDIVFAYVCGKYNASE